MPDDPYKASHTSEAQQPPRLGKTMLEDLNREDLRSLQADLKEIYDFYLDPATRRELDEMDDTRRWLYLLGWLLKSSILKLSANRRLILLAGVFFFIFGVMGNMFALVFSFLTLLLVLILELKDKLLAQDELEAGRAVQLALLPQEQPTLPGWETWLFTRPANEVGGDLVDFQRMDTSRLALVLGDVAGKGLGAALVMAKLQSTLRAISNQFTSLAELGAQANCIMCRDGLPSRFVSMLYAELKAGSGHVRLVNAGHMPPLVVRADRLDCLDKGSMALGLTADAQYSEQHVHLDSGDLLLMFSDGLTEARNDKGHFFDDRRLHALLPRLRGLSAEEAGKRLLGVVDRFVGEARPNDDLSLILIKRLPPSSLHGPQNGLDISAR